MTGGKLLRRLAGGPGKRLSILTAERREGARLPERRHGPVGAAAASGGSRALDRAPPPGPRGPRRAVPAERLAEEIELSFRRPRRARLPGVLAAVDVVQSDQLRARLDPAADELLDTALAEVIARDAAPGEQHASRTDGGFWVLIPESDPASAFERLRRLSQRIVTGVLDVDDRQVRTRPVVGYAALREAHSVEELRGNADAALADAGRRSDLVPAVHPPDQRRPRPVVARGRARPARGAQLGRPLLLAFSSAVLLLLPFIAYVLAWRAGYDLTHVTYPVVAVALALTAALLWAESCRALGGITPPALPEEPLPPASAVILAELPRDAATVVDAVTAVLAQDPPEELQVLVAYRSNAPHPDEEALAELAGRDERLLLVRVPATTPAGQEMDDVLPHLTGDVVGIFDADHHPAPGAFARAWRWLAAGHDVVQGHELVRNGEASWIARLAAVDAESGYAVRHPGRARLHGYDTIRASNCYWRRRALGTRQGRRAMLSGDVDPSMLGRRHGLSVVSDPGLVLTTLAPTTLRALWRQRLAWAQDETTAARHDLLPALRSPRLGLVQKLGAALVLGWAQVVPWLTLQVVPILAFIAWRDGGLASWDWVPRVAALLVLATVVFAAVRALFAYLLADPRVRRHRSWFGLYALHSALWFQEFGHLAVRVAQVGALTGDPLEPVAARAPIARGTRPPIHDDEAASRPNRW